MMLVACQKETEYIDGMITALSEVGAEEYDNVQGLRWNSALMALQANRQKMSNLYWRIENGEYTDDGYDLENPAALQEEISLVLQDIDQMIDSIWTVEVKDSFDIINNQSQGILSLGNIQYQETTDDYNSMYVWLKSDYMADTNIYVSKDFENIQGNISVLYELSLLDDNEVIQYVENIKQRFAAVETAYPSIADQVASSEFVTLAQKELYTSLGDDITQMKADLQGNITLSTSDELDLIVNDLYALTYFFDNNYTSPAIEPKVYGEISNICELRWFSEEAIADDYTVDWVLTADIDAAETHRWNLDKDWAGFKQIMEFSGNFDGGYHIISGMLLTSYGTFDQCRPGMFHYYLGGTMQNLGLVNLFVNNTSAGTGQGGSLIAYLGGKKGVGGTVERCFVQGVKELAKQDGAFIGRIRGAVVMQDCFSIVDCNANGAAGNSGASSSFFGHIITGPHTLKNIINLGESQNNVFTGGLASTNISVAEGLYYDAAVVGQTRIESGAYATTTVKLSDDGVVTDLATDQWADLSAFETFSVDIWEVQTIPLFDESARPYLKGFDYDKIESFIVPDITVYQ